MTHHVLVVDDDQAECELLQRTLHAAEIQALTLTDSHQAVEILRKQTFDAIFVDVNMPPPDGMEVTRQIRSSGTNRKTPVIMITGHEEPAIVARGFEAGITFFLYKPLVKDRLLNLVRVTQSVNRVEKRRFQRVTVRRKIELHLGRDVLEGHSVDISLNGLLVHASRTFPVGSHVKVRVDMSPGKNPLVVGGVVARMATADSMGIHFDSIGLNESKQLQDFLLPLMLKPDSASSPV